MFQDNTLIWSTLEHVSYENKSKTKMIVISLAYNSELIIVTGILEILNSRHWLKKYFSHWYFFFFSVDKLDITKVSFNHGNIYVKKKDMSVYSKRFLKKIAPCYSVIIQVCKKSIKMYFKLTFFLYNLTMCSFLRVSFRSIRKACNCFLSVCNSASLFSELHKF